MDPKEFGQNRSLTSLMLIWILLLHLCCLASAGALWRDEANSIQQARLPSWDSLWNSLQFDSFPVLYPAILRLWSSCSWTASDAGLRLFGFLIGLCVLASIWLIGRSLGSPAPAVCLALLAIDPVLISEGDSIRPYGIGLLCLLWVYGLMEAYLEKPSVLRLLLATVASVLAVQASYVNAVFVGVIVLCAAGIATLRGIRQRLWCFLVPGFIAAFSLIPYGTLLQQARFWTAILHYKVEWLQFMKTYVRAHSPVFPLVWAGFAAAATWRLAVMIRTEGWVRVIRTPAVAYSASVAVLGLTVQGALVEALGVPPFPRYFLPSLVFAAFSCETALQGSRYGYRKIGVLVALGLTAWPAWSWLRQRHTNVDHVVEILRRDTAPDDLVVVSPWFLHTSFQRYYRGPAEWATVPDLEGQPMMRYDLVRHAMMEVEPGGKTAHRLQGALDRGGAIWFVSQRAWTNLGRSQAPEAPSLPVNPGGSDYVHFRSFWERDIEYRLYACCAVSDQPLPYGGRVWDEEDLLLTCWKPKGP